MCVYIYAVLKRNILRQFSPNLQKKYYKNQDIIDFQTEFSLNPSLLSKYLVNTIWVVNNKQPLRSLKHGFDCISLKIEVTILIIYTCLNCCFYIIMYIIRKLFTLVMQSLLWKVYVGISMVILIRYKGTTLQALREYFFVLTRMSEGVESKGESIEYFKALDWVMARKENTSRTQFISNATTAFSVKLPSP